jgi:hypothetical protein
MKISGTSNTAYYRFHMAKLIEIVARILGIVASHQLNDKFFISNPLSHQ